MMPGDAPASDREDPDEAQEISFEDAIALARRLLGQGRTREAAALAAQIQQAAPEHPDTLHLAGLIHYRLGDPRRALAAIAEALRRAPGNAPWHVDRGNILSLEGDLQAALEAYQEALRLDPGNPGAWRNLGVAHRLAGELALAEQAFGEALAIAPDDPDALLLLGDLYLHRGDFDRGSELLRRAIGLQPRRAEGYRLLATAHARRNELAQATEVYDLWLAADPANPSACHYRAACGGGEVPRRAADDYVAEVFDRFADNFESRLQGRLQYRAPALLADLLEGALPAPAGQLDALDAGCGTGLCGPLLRPWCARLDGVDLSANMLAIAAGKGCYDRLVKAELTAFLAQSAAAYELLVSADTLCYFGDLAEVCVAAAGALRPGGWFAFTVESLSAEEPGETFRLLPHGRYAHRRAYVERCLEAAGLDLAELRPADLRTESGHAVRGLLVLARR